MCAWPRAKGKRRISQQWTRCYAAAGNDAAPDMDDGGKGAAFPAAAGAETIMMGCWVCADKSEEREAYHAQVAAA